MLRLDRLALSQLDIGLRRLSLLSLGQRGYATYTRSKDSYGGKKSTNSLSHSIELAGAATKKKLYGKSKFEREVNAPRRHDPHAKTFNRPAARGLKFGRTDGSYNGSKYTGEHLSDSSSKDSFNFRRRDQDTTSIRGHIASGTRSSKPDYAHSKYGKEDRKPDFKNTRYGKDDRKPDSRNLKYGKEGRKSGSITNRLDPNANVGPPNSGNFAGLRVLPVDERNRHAGLLANIDSFDQLKINPSVRDAIKLGVPAEMEYVKPTDIQKLSIKAMCSGPENKVLKSYLLAAETGSGKTLAYLIPLMSKLKDLEAAEEWKHIQHHPIIRSVVLVPTMELVEQVTKTVKNMSHQVKLRAFGYGVNPQLTPAKITSQRVDVLITTPTKFINLYSKHPNLVQYCSFMVADEADSLLDESFGPEITKAVAMCPNLTELVFTSATIPRSFDKLITKQYPDINRLVTPGIHRVSRRIEFTTVNVWEPPFLDNKELALNQALYSTHTDNKEDGLIKRVIVFRNNRKDVKSTVDFINKVGYDAFGVDGSVPYETRDALIKDFITPAKKIDDSYEKKPHIKVMVTTDLLARGIDMSAVRNVVLYDIPNTSIDLIHRIGRTGRMGKRGRVYLFVNKSENKPWIQGLKSYIRKGMSLA